MTHRSARRRPWSWGILLPVLAVAVLFVTLPDAPSFSTPQPATTTAGQTGLMIGLDPDSGVPIGMPEDVSFGKTVATALDRSDQGLVQETLPGGAVRMDLQGRFQSASVARLNDAGTVETLCTEDADEARDFLQRRDRTPKREVR